MNRRSFLKGVGVITAALTLDGTKSAELDAATEIQSSTDVDTLMAAPCGLYCGACPEHIRGACHGCRCKCGKCDGAGHAENCRISRCSRSRKINSCSKCAELPCTKLIQFSVHPIWRTHTACVENLRRQKKIGLQAWLKEQKEFWSDPEELRARLQLYDDCDGNWQEFKKKQDKNGA